MAELETRTCLGEYANIEELVLEPPLCGRTHFKTAMNFIRAYVDLEHETNASIRKIFLTRMHSFPVLTVIAYVTLYFASTQI
jgi:hypothetical protein